MGGLRDMVNGSEMKYRERVLYIIDNVPDRIIGNTSRKKQLMDLGGGNAWRYMEKEFFPSLRVGLSTVKIIMQPDTVPEIYNPQIQISAESETKRSIFREKDKTKRSKKESAQHSKSRNKSFVMTSVSAL